MKWQNKILLKHFFARKKYSSNQNISRLLHFYSTDIKWWPGRPIARRSSKFKTHNCIKAWRDAQITTHISSKTHCGKIWNFVGYFSFSQFVWDVRLRQTEKCIFNIWSQNLNDTLCTVGIKNFFEKIGKNTSGVHYFFTKWILIMTLYSIFYFT